MHEALSLLQSQEGGAGGCCVGHQGCPGPSELEVSLHLSFLCVFQGVCVFLHGSSEYEGGGGVPGLAWP